MATSLCLTSADETRPFRSSVSLAWAVRVNNIDGGFPVPDNSGHNCSLSVVHLIRTY